MKTTLKNIIFTASLLCIPITTVAKNLTRGPYLQMTGEDHVTIRWSTDQNSSTTLRYGKSLDTLNVVTSENLATKNHEITLQNLESDQKYFYAIYDGEKLLSGADEHTYFHTAPVKNTKKKTRIWVLGDPGRAGTDPDTNAQKIVRDGFLTFSANQAPDFWLMLGDNAYNDGTIVEYDHAVFAQYPTLLKQSPLWPIMGNHDNRSADVDTQNGGFYDLFTLPTQGQSGGIASSHEAYYSFDYGNIHVVVLNSSDREHYKESDAMLEWLKQDLAANNSEWLIATFHHPVYGKSGHDSDEAENMIYMRERFLPILEEYGVDLIMAGHNHFYTRSVLMADHYGMSNSYDPSKHVIQGGSGQLDKEGAYTKKRGQKGAIFITHGAGAGSGRGYARLVRTDEITEGKRHPTDYIYGGRGSIVLDIEDTMLTANVIGPQGDIVDYFTLRHNNGEDPINNPPQVKMQIPTQLSVFESGHFSSEGSFDSDGRIADYLWQFGDGNSSSLANTNHQYSRAGDYAVSLTITDNQGISSSTNSRISVLPSSDTELKLNQPIKVSGGAKEAIYFFYEVKNTEKSLTISISGGQGDADLYVRRAVHPTNTEFDCRPYKNGNAESCEITDIRTGLYYVMLYGHKSFTDVALTATQDQTSAPTPSADANGPYQTALGTPVHFSSAGSNDPNQSELTYSWDFGDGNSSTLASPTHTYDQIGEYAVSLTVSNTQGISNSDTTSAHVLAHTDLVDSCAQGTTPQAEGRLLLNQTYCLEEQNRTGQLQYQFYVNDQDVGKDLLIKMGHGSGNADPLYRYAKRPDQQQWDARDTSPGNATELKIKAIQKGWHYIHITTEESFQGVSLKLSIH
ncbi:PKD domain-containing protein [Pseudoalteromonas luteoviolacea]|uniref:PKD domain-containing protein n=1 Tax=Pseudoalteromonas luteoviolacea TaxID=43657 RepID=UPI001B3584A9|nr:PKD domain-containing protein [Pseudoalteromonas luteoviolacea]MBQ4836424.1 PKD domain-containing protein [Pseudoalteromonas luteoviolacea]